MNADAREAARPETPVAGWRVWARAVSFAVYGIACTAALLVLLPALALHPKLRGGLARRLGRYAAGWDAAHRGPPADSAAPRVWVHAASAGDVRAVMPVVRALRRRLPDAWVVLSTMTNSGQSVARELPAGEVDAVTVMPYDAPFAVRGALATLRPDVLLLEVAELWPVLLGHARRAGVRVAVTNGRLSPERLARYRLLFWFTGNLLESIDLLLMRGDAEVGRAVALGAAPAWVLATGNTKLDGVGEVPERAAARAALGLSERDRVVVAGSTHAGEETAALSALVRLRAQDADAAPVRLVLAPRELGRCERVVDEVVAAGFSAWRCSAGPAPPDAAVLVLDRFGELPFVYAAADAAFVGGSLVRRGGHNLLEPAAAEVPVLFGPHTENCEELATLLLGRGGLRVADADGLYAALRELLARPAEARAIGRMARVAAGSQGGVAARNAELVASLAESRVAARMGARRGPGGGAA